MKVLTFWESFGSWSYSFLEHLLSFPNTGGLLRLKGNFLKPLWAALFSELPPKTRPKMGKPYQSCHHHKQRTNQRPPLRHGHDETHLLLPQDVPRGRRMFVTNEEPTTWLCGVNCQILGPCRLLGAIFGTNLRISDYRGTILMDFW